jgi:predicted chitinase
MSACDLSCQSRYLNAAMADAGNFDAITLRVNRGSDGQASRDAYDAPGAAGAGGVS